MTTSVNPVVAYNPANTAELCILLADVMDTYVASKAAPTLTPEILPDSDLARNWNLVGYLVADRAPEEDRPEDKHTAFFGVLVKSKVVNGPYAVVFRGTNGWREWAGNFEVGKLDFPQPRTCAPDALVCYPGPHHGRVHDGFFELYSTLRYLPLVGGASVRGYQGIVDAISDPDVPLYVVGHSLGAALATYLTFDLETLGNRRAKGVFVATPKPGSAEFAKAFDETVAEYVVYDYVRDMVPDLPPSFLGYRNLPRLIQLTADSVQAVIKDDVVSNHDALCYAAMLDYKLKSPEQWKALLVRHDSMPDSIQGPSGFLELAA